jgi:hypothetical protein
MILENAGDDRFINLRRKELMLSVSCAGTAHLTASFIGSDDNPGSKARRRSPQPAFGGPYARAQDVDVNQVASARMRLSG